MKKLYDLNSRRHVGFTKKDARLILAEELDRICWITPHAPTSMEDRVWVDPAHPVPQEMRPGFYLVARGGLWPPIGVDVAFAARFGTKRIFAKGEVVRYISFNGTPREIVLKRSGTERLVTLTDDIEWCVL